ncbi:sodium-dependent transporter [Candidatus Albibeggiatoa sp. nov. BB20]|uniref:sodium-dependent transporter n=1 Tax=Candidatus Albibeggiatoa sp. nov. BB20 TaxID=3162723 RepID=UPI003365B043
MHTSIHGQWSSRLAFILAATGSAVGLGNIWRFPYITGENGGGAFVLVYLACIFLIGLPVMMAEVMLGRKGRHSPINTMSILARENNRSQAWQLIGWSGVIAGFLILSYYSVIAGWSLAYIPRLAMGTFSAVSDLSSTAAIAEFAGGQFNGLIGDYQQLIFWHTLFMIGTMVIISGGVQGGLEKATTFMMPALFALLLILVGYALSTDKFMEGFLFLFKPDFSRALTGKAILDALGQAFFTLSLGMGAIMIYGAYLPKNASIAFTTTMIVIADTSVALLAGLVIFPLVFSNGLEVAGGAGLAFQTLPIAFGQMPYGSIFGTLFFVLLSLAAWSSAISIIEPAVAWLVETDKFNRLSASLLCGIGAWLMGFLTIFSFNIWADVHPLASIGIEKTWFDLLEYVTFNIMMPLGGLFMAIFVAWFINTATTSEELHTSQNSIRFKLWLFLLRYVTPIGVGIVFLNAIGVLKMIGVVA